MGFYEPPEKKERTTRRTRYLKVKEGSPAIVLILDAKPFMMYTHWTADGSGRRFAVRCLGYNRCPICQNNQRLNFNTDHPDFIYRSTRYRVNVLDLTLVKRCPGCGTTYRADAAPARCMSDGCNTDFSEISAEALKEVKIFEKGPMWMKQIGALEKSPHPFTGETMKVTEFPIQLAAQGTGFDTTAVVVPQMPREDIDPADYEEQKYDLKTGLVLNPEEIEYILNGGNLSDVLADRSASEEATEEGTEEEKEKRDTEIPF